MKNGHSEASSLETSFQRGATRMPAKDMAHRDRFRMTIKEFGEEVVIELNRGQAVCSEDGKTVTIKYADSPNRGKQLPRKKSK